MSFFVRRFFVFVIALPSLSLSLSILTDDFRQAPDGDPAPEQRVQVRAAERQALRGRRGAEVAETEGERRRHLLEQVLKKLFRFAVSHEDDEKKESQLLALVRMALSRQRA